MHISNRRRKQGRALALGILLIPPLTVRAQDSAARAAAAGDSAQATLNESAALVDYRKAIALDSSNYAVLCQASRVAVDLGEFDTDDERRTQEFNAAAQYARRAIAIHPDSANGHFFLARALGRQALTLGAKGRVHYAVEVRAEADTALARDPNHAGALHVMGLWNAEVMRLSGIERFMARHLLGGKVLGEANWEAARQDLERAVALEPNRITHHLDLGKVYSDLKMKEKAREQYQTVLNLPAREYNDSHYKDEARRLISRL